MIKDTYDVILAEIREIVKQILSLKKRTWGVRERIGKEKDSIEIEEIRKKIQE